MVPDPPASLRIRPPVLPLFLITLVGLGLRAAGLAAFDLTRGDEVLLWDAARFIVTLGEEGRIGALPAPPLAPALYALACKILAPEVRSAVWVSCLASTAQIALAYALGRRLFGVRAGLVAAVLTAVSGIAILLSRSILPDALFVTLFLAVLWTSVCYAEERRVRWVFWSSLFGALLMCTRYEGFCGVLPLASLLGASIVRRAERPQLWRNVAHLSLLVGPVAVVGGLDLVAIGTWGDLAGFFRAVPGSESVSGTELFATVRWVLPEVVLCAAVFGVAWAWWRRRWTGLSIVSIALGTAVCLPILGSFRLGDLALFSALACVFAGAAFDGMFIRTQGSRATTIGLRTLGVLLALAALVEVARDFDRTYLVRFDGYARASTWLASQPEPRPVLLLAQPGLLDDLDAPVFNGLEDLEGARAFALEHPEVLVVVDFTVASRRGEGRFARIVDMALPRERLVRIDNAVGLDALSDHLTFAELERLEAEPQLRERLLGIHVLALSGDDVLDLLAQE